MDQYTRKCQTTRVYNPAPRAAISSPMKRRPGIKRTFDETLDTKLQEYVARKTGSKKQKLCDTINIIATEIRNSSKVSEERHKKTIFLEDLGKTKKITRRPGKDLTRQADNSADFAKVRQAVIDKNSDVENQPSTSKSSKKNRGLAKDLPLKDHNPTSFNTVEYGIPIKAPKVLKKDVAESVSSQAQKGKEKQTMESFDSSEEAKATKRNASRMHVEKDGVPCQPSKKTVEAFLSTTKDVGKKGRKSLRQQVASGAKLKFDNVAKTNPVSKNMSQIKERLAQLTASKNEFEAVKTSPSDSISGPVQNRFKHNLGSILPENLKLSNLGEIGGQNDKREPAQLQTNQNISKTKERKKIPKAKSELRRKTPSLTNFEYMKENEVLKFTKQNIPPQTSNQSIAKCREKKPKSYKLAKGATTQLGNIEELTSKPALQNAIPDRKLTQITEKEISKEAIFKDQENESQKQKPSGLQFSIFIPVQTLRPNYSRDKIFNQQSKQKELGSVCSEMQDILKDNLQWSDKSVDIFRPCTELEWSSQMLGAPSKMMEEFNKKFNTIFEEILLANDRSSASSRKNESSSSWKDEQSNSAEKEQLNPTKHEDIHSSEGGVSTSAVDTNSTFSKEDSDSTLIEDYEQLGKLLEQRILEEAGDEQSGEILEQGITEDEKLRRIQQQMILAEDLYLSSTDNEE